MSKLNKTIECFKNPRDAQGMLYCHPMLLLILADMTIYIAASGYNPVITSLIRNPDQNRKVGSVSDTHTTGRSIDFRAKDWDQKFIKDFTEHFSTKYKGYGATGSDGQEKLLVFHGQGDNFHLHVQINREYTIPDAWLRL